MSGWVSCESSQEPGARTCSVLCSSREHHASVEYLDMCTSRNTDTEKWTTHRTSTQVVNVPPQKSPRNLLKLDNSDSKRNPNLTFSILKNPFQKSFLHLPFSFLKREINFLGGMTPTFFFWVAILLKRSERQVRRLSFFRGCTLYAKTFSRKGRQKYRACKTELQ